MGQILSTIFLWWCDKIDNKKKLTTGKPPPTSPNLITDSTPSLRPCSDFQSDNAANLEIQVVVNENRVSARPRQQYNRVEETQDQMFDPSSNLFIPSYNFLKGKGKRKISSLEARRIKHYRSDYKILLVGEGDFSFSASLALAFASATNITATSLDSIEFLITNYSCALSNINTLRSLGALVMHDVDATKMADVFPFKHMLFDRVIYNFPLAGFFTDEERKDQIRRNQKLIRLFLQNAKKMTNIDGEIHITHKCNGFFKEWSLEFIASRVGLRFIEEVLFNLRDYPGYSTKYGFGGDKDFNCVPSKTYKYGLSKPT